MKQSNTIPTMNQLYREVAQRIAEDGGRVLGIEQTPGADPIFKFKGPNGISHHVISLTDPHKRVKQLSVLRA